MFKLLVDAPSGAQEVVEVTESGSYFEPERVLWDERIDGSLPEQITLGGMRRTDGALVFDSEKFESAKSVILNKIKADLIESVDSVIAAIYAKWMRFEAEYVEREAAAREFVAMGYEGDPGTWVTAFASSAGKTLQEAADLIITQADNLRTALKALGALRMTKYGIRFAADEVAAIAIHDSIIAQAQGIASSLS